MREFPREDRIKFIDISEPYHGAKVFIDKYFVCKNGDLKQCLVYSETLQCNSVALIAESLNKPFENYYSTEVVFSPISYVPIYS